MTLCPSAALSHSPQNSRNRLFWIPAHFRNIDEGSLKVSIQAICLYRCWRFLFLSISWNMCYSIFCFRPSHKTAILDFSLILQLAHCKIKYYLCASYNFLFLVNYSMPNQGPREFFNVWLLSITASYFLLFHWTGTRRSNKFWPEPFEEERAKAKYNLI